MALFFMDLNGLKQINDSLGHMSGDDALRDTANVLRHTFRGSDIVARFGGDEFVALAHLHSELDIETLCARVREHLREFNAAGTRPYPVDLSIGATLIDHPEDQDLEAFIARADEAMYSEKRRAGSPALLIAPGVGGILRRCTHRRTPIPPPGSPSSRSEIPIGRC